MGAEGPHRLKAAAVRRPSQYSQQTCKLLLLPQQKRSGSPTCLSELARCTSLESRSFSCATGAAGRPLRQDCLSKKSWAPPWRLSVNQCAASALTRIQKLGRFISKPKLMFFWESSGQPCFSNAVQPRVAAPPGAVRPRPPRAPAPAPHARPRAQRAQRPPCPWHPKAPSPGRPVTGGQKMVLPCYINGNQLRSTC